MRDIALIKGIAKDVWIARGRKDGQNDENWKIAEHLAKCIDDAINESVKKASEDIKLRETAIDYWKRRSYELFDILVKIKNIPLFMGLLWLFTEQSVYIKIKSEIDSAVKELKEIV